MSADLTRECVVEASKQQISADLAGEKVVLNNKDGIYYSLNPVGAHIWNLIKEPRSVQEILNDLLQEFDTDEQTCEADLQDLMRDMARIGLVEIRHATNS